MEISKKISLDFFQKSRPNTSKESLKKIIPFKWSNEKEILSGKYKDRKIIKLTK